MSGVHPYIQRLIDAGAVAAYFDFRSLSYRDWSAEGNHGDPTGGRLSHFGYLTKDTAGIDVAYSASLNLSAGPACATVALLAETFQPGVYPSPRLFDQNNGLLSYITGGTSWVFQIGAAYSILVNASGHYYRCFSNSWTAGGKPKFYGNGLYRGEGSAALAANASTSKIVIANNTAGGIRPFHNNLAALILFNRALTDTEHALVYDALEATKWPTSPYSHAPARNLTKCDDTGLVAAYNMRPVGGKVYDLGPNRNDADVFGAAYIRTALGDAARFDGVDDYLNAGDGFQAIDDVTVSCLFRINRVPPSFGFLFNYFLNTSDSWGVYVLSSGNLAIFDDFGNANTARYSRPIALDVWHHLAVQMSGLENRMYLDAELVGSGESSIKNWSDILGTLYIGGRGVIGGGYDWPGDIANFSVKGYVATADEIRAEYNAGASALLFKGDWCVRETAAPVTAGTIGGSPVRRSTGTWAMSLDEKDGSQVKCIECLATGIIYLPTSLFRVGPKQAAFGDYRFLLNQAGASSFLRVAFIANEPINTGSAGFNGYGLSLLGSSRAASLLKYTSGSAATLFTSASGYYEFGEWNDFSISRSQQSGLFEASMNGGLIDVTGGSGSNPVADTSFTDSEYIVIVGYTGDKIGWAGLDKDFSIKKLLGVPK